MHERVTSNNEYFLVFETKEPPIYQKIQNLEKKKKKFLWTKTISFDNCSMYVCFLLKLAF